MSAQDTTGTGPVSTTFSKFQGGPAGPTSSPPGRRPPRAWPWPSRRLPWRPSRPPAWARALGVGDRSAGGQRQGHAQPVVPPRDRNGQAGPHRNVDRPGHGSVSHAAVEMATERLARSPVGGCSWWAPARWARVSPPRWSTPEPPTSASPTAHRSARRVLAARVGGRVVPFAELRRRSPRPTCC